MKFEVKNRWTGAVQFVAEIECGEDTSFYMKLGLAVRWAIKNKANMSDADMSGADLCGADMRGADLCGANMSGADMSGADMRGADMRGANMRGANMSDANMSGADLCGDKIARHVARAERSDGYQFDLFALQAGGHTVKAGCRWFTLEEYRAHVADTYAGSEKAARTLAILNYFEAVVALERG